MNKLLPLTFAAALIAGAAGPAFAGQPEDRGDTPGLGWGPGGKHTVGAPGPVAGVGLALPAILVIGGIAYALFRRQSAPSR